ncbi:MAG: glycoside hydrolase family 97 protein [Flavobacteriaceae bacterium]|nr:glycoside hydrolase family 97 protein [Flavobacteriaceae bacterium]
MKFKYFLVALLILFFVSCKNKNRITATKDKLSISSPNKTFLLELNTTNYLVKYNLFFNGIEIIHNSKLGLEISGKNHLENVKIESVEKSTVDSSWKPLFGEKNTYPDTYNEALVSFVSTDNLKTNFQLRIRAYDEGVAFRYEFEGAKNIEINKEFTEFTFLKDVDLWVATKAQSDIKKKKISEIQNEIIERPLVAQLNDSLFIALGEANLVDFTRMKFAKNKSQANGLIASLDSKVNFNQSFRSPWRVIMAGKSAGILLENNYLFLNLSEPNKIKNRDWIKPGKVLREVTLTTQGGLASVDFAVKNNLQYVEFDAGWYGPEENQMSDASKVNVDPRRSAGPLNLQKVIDYGGKNGIGILLYVNQKALGNQIDQILPLYKKWGIKGVKYGFVNVGSQKATKWLHNAIKKAADNELMVDIHDEYRPTGFSRTYPNLMTQEGVRGDEESPENATVLKTIFTRMIAGAADHTNCYFAERVDEMGSHVSQMAKTILIYSPWQFLYWYDRPEESPQKKDGVIPSFKIIREIPDIQFYNDLPTVWDDTKVLEGEIAKFATIARKNGDDWYIGSISDSARKVTISLEFLDKNENYIATIYQDNDSLATQTRVAIHKIEVSNDSVLNFDIAHKNGLAIIIKKKN